jgi:hypothetical protein
LAVPDSAAGKNTQTSVSDSDRTAREKEKEKEMEMAIELGTEKATEKVADPPELIAARPYPFSDPDAFAFSDAARHLSLGQIISDSTLALHISNYPSSSSQRTSWSSGYYYRSNHSCSPRTDLTLALTAIRGSAAV